MNPTDPPPGAAVPPPPIGATAAWLGRIRRTARAVLVTQRLGWVVAWVFALLLVAGGIDYVLRTPDWLRVALLAAGLAGLGLAIARVVWPAVRFNPSLTQVALRVERTERARTAGLGGLLASGLELSGDADPRRPALTAGLSRPIVADAARRAASIESAGLVSPARALRSLGWAGGALAAVALVALLQPALAGIGAERLLWPWGGAEWPKRTGIADADGRDADSLRVHPLGTAFALRAAVTRAPGDPDDVRVAARYRLITDGEAGPVRRVLLTSQGRTVPVFARRGDGASTEGSLYERLIEPAGLTPGGPEAAADAALDPTRRTELEYWFETEDDATDPRRVLLVEPPEVLQAQVTIQPPAYAAALADPAPAAPPLDLGPGTDERAAPAPILAGSRLRLTIELNKPVPVPGGQDPAQGEAWLLASLGPDAASLFRPATDDAPADLVRPAATFSADGPRWTIAWTLSDPVRLAVKATDEHGIASAEETVYRFDSLRDGPPTATVTAPQEDASVLATAVVELVGEARDDVGLAWLGVEGQRARKPETSEGAAPEPVEDPVAIGERVSPAAASASDPVAPIAEGRRLVVARTLDLSTLDLKPGDEVWLTALAADAYDLDGVRHEPVRSSIRRLRILSREQLVEQVWSELGDVRRTAIRLDEDQTDVAEESARTPGRGTGAESARRAQRAQAGITERLARQADAIDRVRERLEENGLDDQSLEHVLNEAKATLERAGEGSTQGSESLGDAADAESAEGAPPEAGREAREAAAEAQDDVRRELADLVDLLDQGEDTWASKRAVEQILGEQKALQARTAETGQSTTGKPDAALAPEEKAALDAIAQEQEALADRLREAIDKMLEREQKMRQTDPAAAQALAQAAKRGQREQAAEKMDQASQQAGQNQTNNAQQQQQQAIESMESMLNELEQTAANRDEVLKRYLASLIESIEALIAQQGREIDALTAAAADAPDLAAAAPVLAEAMIRVHQNTLGVQDEAANGPREVAPVADLLGEAAAAQATAIVPLRKPPVADLDSVTRDESIALDKLTEARDLAQRLEQEAAERQQDRKRAQLRKEYEAALRQQISLREAAEGLLGAEASRRNRSAARLIGQDAQALRATLKTLRDETKELQDAKVFDYAHTRLDALMTAAAAALETSVPDAATVQRQVGAARILQGLVDALDTKKKDRPFRENQQEGGGGGGGQGEPPLVPPAAEVRLLRAMQQEAADLTRALADAAAAAPTDLLTEVGQLQSDLAGQAQDLLERIKNQGGGGGDGGGGEVVPSPDPAGPDAPPGNDDPAAPEKGAS